MDSEQLIDVLRDVRMLLALNLCVAIVILGLKLVQLWRQRYDRQR